MRPFYDALRRRVLCVAVCALIGAVPIGSALAQELSNRGSEFLLTYLRNTIDGPPIVELHLTGANTDVTVEYPANAPTFVETVTISADEITVVALPHQVSSAWSMNATGTNVVRASAETDFVAYMVNIRQFTSDASMALPVATMNVEYFTTHYNSSLVAVDRSEFAVVAAFDNTEVRITPTANMGSVSAGETHVVTLNRGEAFYGQGNTNGAAGDLTGTRIVATRPVGVTSGNYCTNVPPTTAACDHVFQVAHPIQTWGDYIPVVNVPNRPSGSIYRIVAAEDGTEILQNGAALVTLNRGDRHDVGPAAGAHVFSSEKPLFVTQYMTGVLSPGATLGDPAMGSMIPSAQYLNSYVFSTVGGALFSQNWLTVIAENEDVGTSVRLDGELVDASAFTAIPGTSLSWAQVRLEEGTHITTSTRPHGITVAGYNPANSYLFPGGARFEFIAPGEDTEPPVCAFDLIADEARGTVRDDRPGDSGVFFVRLAEGSENVSLAVSPFTPGDALVNWTLSLINPATNGMGTVVGVDGSGNQCRVDVRLGEEIGECDDLMTLPSWDGVIHSNGDGTGYLVLKAPQGLARANFYNTHNLRTDLSAAGYVEAATNDWVWDGEEGEEPTEVTVQLETIDKTSGQIRFWVRVYDTCPRWVDIDPTTDLGAEIPDAFAIDQNYPNPFNPTTTIAYHLPEATHVTLTVYDVLGREIMRLVDGQHEAGTHQVTWHGTRSDGSAVSSGVYLYRIEAGTFTRTQTMNLVK